MRWKVNQQNTLNQGFKKVRHFKFPQLLVEGFIWVDSKGVIMIVDFNFYCSTWKEMVEKFTL